MNSKNIFWLLFLAILWGPSFLFIKVAVSEIPPLTMVTMRVGLAALLLYFVLRIKKCNLPGFKPIWKHFAVLGLFAHAVPFVLLSWGELHIDSAMASILNGTTPLFTILIAHFFIAEERLTFSKFMGSVLGFQGLFVLISPSLLAGVEATALGIAAATLAACSYGIAMVYARKHLRGLPPLVAPTAQLTMATIYMLPLSMYFERPFSLGVLSPAAVGSVSALAVFGTAIAFIVYYRILEGAGATYLSMVTYLVPVFGVILGVLVLNETLNWNAYAGCALILLGVMVVNGAVRIPQRIVKLVEA